MKIRIKYFEGAKKLEKIEKGDWIADERCRKARGSQKEDRL